MPAQDGLHIERRTGEDIAPIVPDLADLRISVFSEWPYLYAGDQAYERDYLSGIVGSPRAIVVLAMLDTRIVGAATGMPMADEVDAFRKPFENEGIDPREVFYLADSVLLPEFRGKGIGARFFEEREDHARSLGYRYTAFCAVERSPADPRRPADYVPLDNFWSRLGYERTVITTSFSWKEHGEGVATPKTMRFWFKTLA